MTITLRYDFEKLKKRAVTFKTEDADLHDAHSSIHTKSKPKAAFNLGESFSSALRYGAYLSLVIAFAVGMNADSKDYESMIRTKFKDEKLTKINDAPVVFELGEKKAEGGEYILIQEGQGYGGPFVIGVRIHDDAKVLEVVPLADKETPAFIKKIKEANYRDQFIGRSV